ncbi:MAG: 50S ribosomal protein L2 [Candidatus Woesearchaeota archaeon]
MGKPIIAQKRGKGSPTYTANSHRYAGVAKHAPSGEALIVDLINCPGHSAPLALVEHENGLLYLNIAGEGCMVGETVEIGSEGELKVGNTLALKDLPEGTPVFNIESQPGDGGKFCRGSGSAARVVGKTKTSVTVMLPSKKTRTFNGGCKATIGVVAGGGRVDKPLLKAGNAFHKNKARNKLWPRTSPNSMAAYDHPYGNTRSSRKSKSKPAPRDAPPGRRVGSIRARQTGRK